MRKGRKRYLSDILKRAMSVSAAVAIMLSSTFGSVYGYDGSTEQLPESVPESVGSIPTETVPLEMPGNGTLLPTDTTGNEQPENILPTDANPDEPTDENPAEPADIIDYTDIENPTEPADITEPDDGTAGDDLSDYTPEELEKLRYELSQVNLFMSDSGLRGLGINEGTELDPKFNVLLTPEDMNGVYVPTSANKRHYRSLLNPDEQACYDIIISAAESFHNNRSTMPLTPVGDKYACITVDLPKTINALQVRTVYTSVIRDNPRYFWIDTCTYIVNQDSIRFTLFTSNGDSTSRINIARQTVGFLRLFHRQWRSAPTMRRLSLSMTQSASRQFMLMMNTTIPSMTSGRILLRAFSVSRNQPYARDRQRHFRRF